MKNDGGKLGRNLLFLKQRQKKKTLKVDFQHVGADGDGEWARQVQKIHHRRFVLCPTRSTLPFTPAMRIKKNVLE
jgi:hypothetical protein